MPPKNQQGASEEGQTPRDTEPAASVEATTVGQQVGLVPTSGASSQPETTTITYGAEPDVGATLVEDDDIEEVIRPPAQEVPVQQVWIMHQVGQRVSCLRRN